MNCKQAREHLLDLAQESAAEILVPGLDEHLRACDACAAELASVRQTMALLDEWQAPEPSPYFDSRLRARLREEAAVSRGWLDWFRKPAIAAALAALIAVGVTLFRSTPPAHIATNQKSVEITSPQTGSAVDDLQQLDQNGDMYASFDVLDELANQDGNRQEANP